MELETEQRDMFNEFTTRQRAQGRMLRRLSEFALEPRGRCNIVADGVMQEAPMEGKMTM